MARPSERPTIGQKDSPFDPLAVECLYQPIVEIDSGQVVAFEALARWPGANRAPSPATVFADARAQGWLVELDRAAQQAAVRGAQEAGLPDGYTLFVNVETDTTTAVSLQRTLTDFGRHGPIPRLVFELTERALLQDPGQVLEITDSARALGAGVALDDVGAHPDSVTMLEFTRPDVIKLDRTLIGTAHLGPADIQTYAAVAAYAEHTPVAIIAEGIESAADLERARALGATHGQGWFFGRPGPLPARLSDLSVPLTLQRPVAAAGTPAQVLDQFPPRTGRRSLLLALTRHLEDAAAALGEPATVLAAFQDTHIFTPTVAERFSAMARDHTFVAAVGPGLTAHPAPGVRGAALSAGDNLANEWTLAIVAPHFYAALIARDLGDPVHDPDRRYHYLFTHDRDAVIAAARSLMHHIHAP